MRILATRRAANILILLLGLLVPSSAGSQEPGTRLVPLYQQQVNRRLVLPEEEQRRYATLLSQALTKAGLDNIPAQFLVLVDRDIRVQAAMIFWKSEFGDFHFIGASPVSTGKPGRFEHFETPLGVFPHTLENFDFRAEGTLNEFGILGYGRKGMRIYDFGWIDAPKGWGDGRVSTMRLQMHATDPKILEPRLGSAQSKGCVRIPTSLNLFIDRYGILDAAYDRALSSGHQLWVLSPDREPTPWSGQYLVVVDTERDRRPQWSR